MKAFLIDTPAKQIREIEYDNNWKSISPLIRAECFTLVYVDKCATPDAIYVDDEGLINGNPHGWFQLDTYGQPLRGYGLVLGSNDEGKSVEPRVSLAELQNRISFPDNIRLEDIDTSIRVTAF